jgi:replication initiation and membrane attachment protein
MKLKSTFKVLTSNTLSSDDFKVLILLYQPLIGYLAYALYQVLYNLVNRQNYQSQTLTHQFLTDLLNERLDQIKEAKEKLEALNLLETYKDQDDYVYVVKSPLTPRGFLKDTILGQFLLSEIGEKNFQMITEHFKIQKLDLSSYEPTTKQFDDVFKFEPMENYKDEALYYGKKTNGGAKITYHLNYDAFVEQLPDRVKKPILMNWKTEDTIQKLYFVYQFTMEEMVDVYLSAVKPSGDIDLANLAFKAQSFYMNKKKELPVASETKLDDDKLKSIQYLKTVSPMKIIENYANPKSNYQLMATDTVLELLSRKQVEVGIINVLLMHILKYKEGILPHVSYLEKVLETWFKQGIATTEDAFELVLRGDFEKGTTTTKGSKKKKQNPKWVDEYLQELKEWGGE